MQQLQQAIQVAQSEEEQQMLQQQTQKMQIEIESKIAVKIDEMTTKMITEEQEMFDQEDSDPLIRLKEQELQLKAMDLKRKDEETDLRLEVERERIASQDKIAQDRMDSQEDIAQLRANVNLSKAKKIKNG